MLDNKYYAGFEGESEVQIYYEAQGESQGLSIWDGYFCTLLHACDFSEMRPGGLLQAYWNGSDWEDEDQWILQDPQLAARELRTFSPDRVDEGMKDITPELLEIRGKLLKLIDQAQRLGAKIYMTED